jgi:hypothetical protein
MNNAICIIPARGGSVRLPRKNVKLFCNVPLIAWSIVQAKACKYVNKVVVVTDDQEISDVSRNYGAEVIIQPDWMKERKPHGGMAVSYALKECLKIDPTINIMLSMMCTNPLVLPGQLDDAFELFDRLKLESLLPMIPLREIVLTRRLTSFIGRTEIFSKGYEYLREGGNWGIAKVDYVLETDYDKNTDWPDPTMDEFKPGLTNYFPVEIWQYADTDTLPEFEMAEVLMEAYILKGKGIEVYNKENK